MTGAELKEKRKRLGLSIAALARQLEVSSRTICRWENDEQPIPGGPVKLFNIINAEKLAAFEKT